MGRTTRYLPRRADRIGRFGALASSYAGCAIVRGTEQYVDPVRSPVILKLIRSVDEGVNPDREIWSF